MASIRKRSWTNAAGEQKVSWLVDYRDAAGVRRYKQFDLKKDAEAWRTTATFDVSRGVHTAASQSITVAEASKLWIARHDREGLESTTIAAYEQHVRLHILPLCGGIKLSALTIPIVEEIRDRLMERLSRPMAIRVLRSLTSLVGEAKRRGFVAQNVCADVKIKRASRQAKVVIPSKPEIRMLLRLSSMSADPMAMPLMMLLLFAALRASELRGLCWRHVDMNRKTVSIDQRADAKNVIGPPKSDAAFRTIPLPAIAITVLRRWRAQCPKSQLNLVFPSVAGQVMSHNFLLNNILKPIEVAAGIFEDNVLADGSIVPVHRYPLHDFRHAAASLWIEQRVSPKRIQYWMGHSSIQVTFDLYGHLFEQADQDASIASAIEQVLVGQFEADWLSDAA
jgi:integrase